MLNGTNGLKQQKIVQVYYINTVQVFVSQFEKRYHLLQIINFQLVVLSKSTVDVELHCTMLAASTPELRL